MRVEERKSQYRQILESLRAGSVAMLSEAEAFADDVPGQAPFSVDAGFDGYGDLSFPTSPPSNLRLDDVEGVTVQPVAIEAGIAHFPTASQNSPETKRTGDSDTAL